VARSGPIYSLEFWVVVVFAVGVGWLVLSFDGFGQRFGYGVIVAVHFCSQINMVCLASVCRCLPLVVMCTVSPGLKWWITPGFGFLVFIAVFSALAVRSVLMLSSTAKPNDPTQDSSLLRLSGTPILDRYG